MYLRFITPLRSSVRGVNLGIFSGACECREYEEAPVWLKRAIQEELDFFNEKLPIPQESAFVVKSRKRLISVGICWFKSDAIEMIRRAFALRALLAEYGMFVTTIITDRPGQILYEDDFQIVAKPVASTPTHWG